MRSGFWKADWFLGLAVVILFALSNWVSALHSASHTPSGKGAIIATDKQSIDNPKGWYASSTASAATATVDLEL